jgi:hypothetical protein
MGFCSLRGAELQKKPFCRLNRIGPISLANERAGRPIKARLTLRAWSSLMRPGSKPTWRPFAAGAQEGSVSKQRHLMATGRP